MQQLNIIGIKQQDLTKLKKILYDIKQNIINQSQKTLNNTFVDDDSITQNPIKINSHSLDYAIADAFRNYQTGMKKQLKKLKFVFRLRYIKKNKLSQIFKLEKSAFNEKTFCPKSLGNQIKCSIRNFNYVKHIDTVAIVQYKLKIDKFYLLIKNKCENNCKNKNNIISIDPGIRTIMTGYTNNGIINIGASCQKIISKKLTRIDKIMGHKHIKQAKKQLLSNKIYDKIKNMVDDFHWKVMKYLTDIYKTVLFGNFSTKKMGETNNVGKMTKRIGTMMRFYMLKERLKYKCYYTNTTYKEVKENYTSKCCSVCGNVNKKLGSSKIYNCTNKRCKVIMDRDVNGARNICMKGLIDT